MEISNKTGLSSPIWAYLTRSENADSATCNICEEEKRKQTIWYRNTPCGGKKGEGPNGFTFHISNIRKHLKETHKIPLHEIKYDDSNPTGTNKRVGWRENKIPCMFCGRGMTVKYMKIHWRYG
jgi:hypothetical protein